MNFRSLRVFWAVRPPAPVFESVAQLMRDLETSCAALGLKVGWLKPPSLHITLKFLGDVAESKIDGLVARVRDGLATLPLPPFALRLQGLAAFPDTRQPRILFAAVHPPDAVAAGQGLAPLFALQSACEDWHCELGFAREARPFHPHLTVGRVRNARRDCQTGWVHLFAQHAERRFGDAFPIEEVILYESRLDSDGATYSPLHTLPLSGNQRRTLGHGN